MCQTHKQCCSSISKHIWTSNGEDTSKLKTKQSELVSDGFSSVGLLRRSRFLISAERKKPSFLLISITNV